MKARVSKPQAKGDIKDYQYPGSQWICKVRRELIAYKRGQNGTYFASAGSVSSVRRANTPSVRARLAGCSVIWRSCGTFTIAHTTAYIDCDENRLISGTNGGVHRLVGEVVRWEDRVATAIARIIAELNVCELDGEISIPLRLTLECIE